VTSDSEYCSSEDDWTPPPKKAKHNAPRTDNNL
jgi:hypothetical protein